MTRIWRNLLIAACMLSFLLLLGTFNATKPRILVVHSAAQDSPWATEMDRGMRDALTGNRRPVSVEWLYLDAVSPVGAQHVGQATAEAQRAIARTKPDILIAVDDEANTLVAHDYVGLESPRILYVSLDWPPAKYGYSGAPNVSGLSEELPWHAVRDAVTDLFPGRTPSLSVIGVNNSTGQAEMDQVRAFDWGPVQLGGTALVSAAPEWRGFVDTAAGADVLLVLSTRDLPEADGTVFSAAEVNRWTQEHSKPLPIGSQVDFVTDGGALSFSPDPGYEGERAIRLALDWLDDRTTPGPPPPATSSHFGVAVRQNLLAQRGITLAPIYLEAARENGTLFD